MVFSLPFCSVAAQKDTFIFMDLISNRVNCAKAVSVQKDPHSFVDLISFGKCRSSTNHVNYTMAVWSYNKYVIRSWYLDSRHFINNKLFFYFCSHSWKLVIKVWYFDTVFTTYSCSSFPAIHLLFNPHLCILFCFSYNATVGSWPAW